jgi:TonB family protein
MTASRRVLLGACGLFAAILGACATVPGPDANLPPIVIPPIPELVNGLYTAPIPPAHFITNPLDDFTCAGNANSLRVPEVFKRGISIGIFVDAENNVRDAKILTSSGEKELDNVALICVYRAKFHPATKPNGELIWQRFTFYFRGMATH